MENIDVLRWENIKPITQNNIRLLLNNYDLILKTQANNQPITGSYWGECEAGLVQNTVFIRADTPIHSLFHEACHAICMDSARRNALHTDAGGDDDEENAVCYLQICLAERIVDLGAARMMADMDAWGYHFLAGSARAWFETDAQIAKKWLQNRGILA